MNPQPNQRSPETFPQAAAALVPRGHPELRARAGRAGQEKLPKGPDPSDTGGSNAGSVSVKAKPILSQTKVVQGARRAWSNLQGDLQAPERRRSTEARASPPDFRHRL
jgi:hypothetical protein